MTPITEMLPDELRARADDVVHKVRDDVEAHLPGRSRAREGRRRQARRSPLLWVVGAVVAAALGWYAYQALRGRDERLAATSLGPEVGTPSDVDGPAFDADSPMGAEASAR